MSPVDHVIEAQKLGDLARELDPRPGAIVATVALVHATLAVAEQKRIANRIAYLSFRMPDFSGWSDAAIEKYLADAATSEPQIREGLGL